VMTLRHRSPTLGETEVNNPMTLMRDWCPHTLDTMMEKR
jgi:hypothetical protein